MNSDPEKVERVAAILEEQIPGAKVTSQDPGGGGPVGFTITTSASKGAAIFRVSWERFQEDQAETEEFVRQAIRHLAPGESWLMTSTGELVPFP